MSGILCSCVQSKSERWLSTLHIFTNCNMITLILSCCKETETFLLVLHNVEELWFKIQVLYVADFINLTGV